MYEPEVIKGVNQQTKLIFISNLIILGVGDHINFKVVRIISKASIKNMVFLVHGLEQIMGILYNKTRSFLKIAVET